jgi:NADH:ubiquinone oxidoreductase subunit C
MPYIFIKHKAQKLKNIGLLIYSQALYYFSIHLKFGTTYYSTHLCDITAYELPIKQIKYLDNIKNNLFKNTQKKNLADQVILIYNFHTHYTQSRYYIFTQNLINMIYSRYLTLTLSIDSITELFFAANWLEREIAELFGIDFNGKKDVRNLMLQYGDTSVPFKKMIPTIGFKEMVYNIIVDILVQLGVNTQS